jgi:hypothetical protein
MFLRAGPVPKAPIALALALALFQYATSRAARSTAIIALVLSSGLIALFLAACSVRGSRRTLIELEDRLDGERALRRRAEAEARTAAAEAGKQARRADRAEGEARAGAERVSELEEELRAAQGPGQGLFCACSSGKEGCEYGGWDELTEDEVLLMSRNCLTEPDDEFLSEMVGRFGDVM